MTNPYSSTRVFSSGELDAGLLAASDTVCLFILGTVTLGVDGVGLYNSEFSSSE